MINTFHSSVSKQIICSSVCKNVLKNLKYKLQPSVTDVRWTEFFY